jgi:hypothetical protein
LCFESLNITRLEPPAIESPDAAPAGPGSGAVAPVVLHGLREPAAELAEVPRSGDPHRVVAALELLIRVGDFIVRDGGRQLLLEEIDVERRMRGETRRR